jgi:hypothetical protein
MELRMPLTPELEVKAVKEGTMVHAVMVALAAELPTLSSQVIPTLLRAETMVLPGMQLTLVLKHLGEQAIHL